MTPGKMNRLKVDHRMHYIFVYNGAMSTRVPWSLLLNRTTKKLEFSLDLLGDDFQINFLDVGCAFGEQKRWSRIAKKVYFIGIDARDDVEIKDFSNKFKGIKLLLGKTLGNPANDDEPQSFYITNHPGASSVFEPNKLFFDRFPKSYKFVSAPPQKLEMIRLSDLNLDVDFVKMDVQGAELSVLQGSGSRFLDNLIGLEIECEFQELYLNQPLFGDVSKFLTGLNFELIDFVNPTRWLRDKPQKYFGQIIASDVLFIKPPHYFFSNTSLSESKWRVYLSLLLIYERFDLLEVSKSYLTVNQQLEAKQFFASIETLKRDYVLIMKCIAFMNRLLKKFGLNKHIFIFG